MSNEVPTQLSVDVAILKTEIKHLTDLIHEQKRVLSNQDQILQELVAMANKGKGSLWMFIVLGGIIGAVISNLKIIVSFFQH